MSEPKWTNEETFKFIELYQEQPSIWNPKHKFHKDKTRVNDAWQRIAEAMSISVQDLKRKKETLLAAFRMNHKKALASIKSGAGDEDIFKPVWIYYDAIASFMGDVYECKKVLVKTEDEQSPLIHEEHTVENQEDPFRSVQRPQKRRQKPAEFADTQTQMNIALTALNKALNNRKENERENECDMYGRLLAHRLKSYSDIERQELMYEIDGLLLKKRKRNVMVYSRSPSETMRSRSPSSSS